MILSILFKALVIYIIYRTCLGLYRAYKIGKTIQEGLKQGRTSTQTRKRKDKEQGEVFEAEFHHLDKE